MIESLRAEIAKTQRVKGNVLDAVTDSDTARPTQADAAKLIKGI